MCHWVRESASERDGAAAPSGSGASWLKPRLVGAALAGVAGVVAAAGLLAPAPPEPRAEPAVATAAPGDTSREAAMAGVPPVIEQTAAGMDDGVPLGAGSSHDKAAGGDCSHAL